jgi:GGDEF domain-containing protein
VLSELDVAIRREFARAVRYREPLSFLLLDAMPTAEILGRVRDGVRLCDSAVPAPPGRVAVILPETPLAGALLVATRLVGALGPSPEAGGSPSIGVSAYPSPTVTDAEGLLRGAEKALLAARSGAGGVRTAPQR